MKILVTGSKGFVGKNLCAALQQIKNVNFYQYDTDHTTEQLGTAIQQVDCVIHLAGVNRPKHQDEFETGNAGFLDDICKKLLSSGNSPKILLSSSIQADFDNPYGVSKRHAENILEQYSKQAQAECVVFRLKNLFGKWCRPNYNSVTATFCYNIANDLPIKISDPSHKIELTHIDDVVSAFIDEIEPLTPGFRYADPLPSKSITLKQLADKIRSYREIRSTFHIPDFNDSFEQALYSTYLSYLDTDDFGYGLDIKSDERGSLAEFIKSYSMGQIFISHTKPGITRGDHFHHTKIEKFFVVQGQAVIRFRHIDNDEIIEYKVYGSEYRVLDIPPGYTHSIENVGKGDLVTLFWASEIFDPERPDTLFLPVKK